jgi:nucleotide-binding universal stress UspA family protein
MQVTHNHPHEAIVAIAKDKGCDIIVMATHGRSGIVSLLLGSVTAKVLAHATVPVVVYR